LSQQKQINDLSLFDCPQLFVQFKWLLKDLNLGKTVAFRFNAGQDLKDVLRYLEMKRLQYKRIDSNNSITIVVEGMSV